MRNFLNLKISSFDFLFLMIMFFGTMSLLYILGFFVFGNSNGMVSFLFFTVPFLVCLLFYGLLKINQFEFKKIYKKFSYEPTLKRAEYLASFIGKQEEVFLKEIIPDENIAEALMFFPISILISFSAKQKKIIWNNKRVKSALVLTNKMAALYPEKKSRSVLILNRFFLSIEKKDDWVGSKKLRELFLENCPNLLEK